MIQEDFAFVIPVIKLRVKDWDDKKQRILNLVDWDDPECLSQHYFSDFCKNMSLGKHPYLEPFDFFISDELDKVAQHLGRDVKITELWAQRYKESQAMPTHNHGAHGFSAILYAEYDKEEHTPTVFYSPFGNFVDGQITVYEPEVEEGDLIVFPSMLLHSSMPFISSHNRSIFSFNMSLI